jgi:hypothetical protein
LLGCADLQTYRWIFARYGYGALPPDLPPPVAVIGAFADLPEALAGIAFI